MKEMELGEGVQYAERQLVYQNCLGLTFVREAVHLRTRDEFTMLKCAAVEGASTQDQLGLASYFEWRNAFKPLKYYSSIVVSYDQLRVREWNLQMFDSCSPRVV